MGPYVHVENIGRHLAFALCDEDWIDYCAYVIPGFIPYVYTMEVKFQISCRTNKHKINPEAIFSIYNQCFVKFFR